MSDSILVGKVPKMASTKLRFRSCPLGFLTMVDPLSVQKQYRFGVPGETAKKNVRNMPKGSFLTLGFAGCRALCVDVGILAG